jgi:hypothetical protein
MSDFVVIYLDDILMFSKEKERLQMPCTFGAKEIMRK